MQTESSAFTQQMSSDAAGYVKHRRKLAENAEGAGKQFATGSFELIAASCEQCTGSWYAPACRFSLHASRLTVHGDLFLAESAEDAEKQSIDSFELIVASCEKCSGDT
jgi:hypothetical protein